MISLPLLFWRFPCNLLILQFCGVESDGSQNLKLHETTCEMNPSALTTSTPSAAGPRKTRIPCELCGKTFSNATSLKTHVGLFHSDGATPTSPDKKPAIAYCVTCQKSFSTKTVLDSHIRMVHWQMLLFWFVLGLSYVDLSAIFYVFTFFSRFIWEKKKFPSRVPIVENITLCARWGNTGKSGPSYSFDLMRSLVWTDGPCNIHL